MTGQHLSLESAFVVLSGVAIIPTAHGHAAVIPAGGCWPGLHRLGTPLAGHVQASEVLLFPGSTTRPATPEELGAGIALIQAQAMTGIGSLAQRIRLTQPLIKNVTHELAALCVNSTRPAFSKIACVPKARGRRRNTYLVQQRRPLGCERFCITRALLERGAVIPTPVH